MILRSVGGIVVIAADNLMVVMACVFVRIRIIIVAVFVGDTVVAVIDIIVRANSARVIGIGGREADAAVILLRTMGTSIKMRRWKCCRAHMRCRRLILGGKTSAVRVCIQQIYQLCNLK